MSDWLSADIALNRLGVRPQTLYAYVSRGRIAARPDPDDPRRSHYRASDIAALATRKARGRKAADVGGRRDRLGRAGAGLGDHDRGGRAAVLSRPGRRAAGGDRDAGRRGAAAARRGRGRLCPATVEVRRRRRARRRGQRAFVRPGESAPRPIAPMPRPRGRRISRWRRRHLRGQRRGRGRGIGVDGGAIHERLGRAWGCGRGGMDLIRRALVLLADHELNASTFAARVTASTGASLSACALAGLSALSGPLHGGVFARVGRSGGRSAPSLRRRRGGGRRAWRTGWRRRASATRCIPRGTLGRGRCSRPSRRRLPWRRLRDGGGGRRRARRDNVDFALVALTEALGLPEEAPFALFAVARCAGWLAHAMEQAASGALIRPRARYVGEAPEA